MFTTANKIAVVEALITARRWSRPDTEPEEYHEALVLKAIAPDLRGRLPEAPGEAMRSLDRRIEAAKRAKVGGHYRQDHLVGLGQEILGRWNVVRQALQQFETAIQEAAE